jgi:hypothetical protein
MNIPRLYRVCRWGFYLSGTGAAELAPCGICRAVQRRTQTASFRDLLSAWHLPKGESAIKETTGEDDPLRCLRFKFMPA